MVDPEVAAETTEKTLVKFKKSLSPSFAKATLPMVQDMVAISLMGAWRRFRDPKAPPPGFDAIVSSKEDTLYTQKLRWQKEYLGLYLDEHPLERAAKMSPMPVILEEQMVMIPPDATQSVKLTRPVPAKQQLVEAVPLDF